MQWGRTRRVAMGVSVLALFVLLAAPDSPAGTPAHVGPLDRVVAPWGSDDGPGTAESPWRTIQHAADRLEPGGTTWIRDGRHAGFVVTRSGEADAPLTFAAWPDEPAPVIDGALDDREDVIRLDEVRFVNVRGLTVTGAQGGVFSGSGIRVEDLSSDVEVTGNLVTDNQGSGVLAHSVTHVLIADNELRHNATGVRVSGHGEGIVIRDNRIHHTDRMLRNTLEPTNDDAGGDGVTLDGSTGAVLVTGNRIWANRARSSDYVWDGGAFSIYAASNVTIVDNVVWDNENVLETGTSDGAPCANNRFLRNVATGRPSQGRTFGLYVRCGSDMLIAHNTLRDLAFGFSVGPDSETFSGSVDGLRIVNNIVDLHASAGTLYGLFAPLPDSVEIDHNLLRTTQLVGTWWDGEAVELADLQARTGFETHALWADPRFVGPDDPSLGPDSPAIDAGIPLPDVNDGWSGRGPDLGARERQGGLDGGVHHGRVPAPVVPGDAGVGKEVSQMHTPGPFPASVLRPPSPSATCSCEHWVHCACDCHERHCDPSESTCDLAFLPDDGGLTSWGCPGCTPGVGSPHDLGCQLIGWSVPYQVSVPPRRP